MYRNQRIVAVVQAKMEARRLPGKVLLSLEERPVLWHVLERVQSIEMIDEVVVATTTSGGDDTIAEFVRWLDRPRLQVFRGPDEDVLERYYLALRDDPPDVVARIRGDAPLVSMGYLRQALCHLIDAELDAVDAVCEESGLTPGLESQVYRYQALVDAHLLAARPSERHHVPLFIRNRRHAFRLGDVEPDEGLCSSFRLSLDQYQDYCLLRRIYGDLYRLGRPIDASRVVKWLYERPDLAAINQQGRAQAERDIGTSAAGE